MKAHITKMQRRRWRVALGLGAVLLYGCNLRDARHKLVASNNLIRREPVQADKHTPDHG